MSKKNPKPLIHNTTGQPDWDWNNSTMCLNCYQSFLPSDIKAHEKICKKNKKNPKRSKDKKKRRRNGLQWGYRVKAGRSEKKHRDTPKRTDIDNPLNLGGFGIAP
jgi:hypothetical protein